LWGKATDSTHIGIRGGSTKGKEKGMAMKISIELSSK